MARLDNSHEIAGAEIIALKQHVDYWNRLGWTDRFSSPAFSQRQAEYGEFFGRGGVYTPQMIVDGQQEFVGSDERTAWAAIERASQTPKAHVELELLGTASKVHLRVRIADLQGARLSDTAELFLAITEGNLSSRVTRGENAGRSLQHTAVVRDLKRIARLNPPQGFTTDYEVPLLGDWKIENLRAVVFVQEQRSRRVLGAAQISFAPKREG
ncbi:MAG: DUF1223 domain-containing protein [Acidobacteriales bacterium]|nr:DUF1223 domain-containing protein [Terriglobales bacterium]